MDCIREFNADLVKILPKISMFRAFFWKKSPVFIGPKGLIMQAANRLDDLFQVNASMRKWVLKVRISQSLLWDLDTQILTPQMHRDGLS